MHLIRELVGKGSMAEYQAVLSHSYFFSKVRGKDLFNGAHVKEGYHSACVDKSEIVSSTDWQELLMSLKSVPSVRKLKDQSHDTPHNLKILISINPESGIGVCMSLLGNFIGFYYMHESEPKGQVCFGQELGYYLSYFPFSPMQKTAARDIYFSISKKLPQFQLFNQNFADYLIKDVQGQTFYYEEIQLFRILFSDQLDGIFF
jgi:hypothetical protein